MPSYDDWFEEPEVGFPSQGDVMRNVEVFIYKPEAERPTFSAQTTDLIVLTQTCDIPKESQQSVLLAEVESYDNVVRERGGTFASKDWRKKLVANMGVAEFLLPPCGVLGMSWSLVNFRELFTMPKSEFAGERLVQRNRIGLASPYREHLSQAYARFMMRVGLPLTLHEFEKFSPPA